MADYSNARDCEHGRLRRSCERCADAFLIAALEARLAEVEQALRKYGQHLGNCNYGVDHFGIGGLKKVDCRPCSCGFRAVLDKGEPG